MMRVYDNGIYRDMTPEEIAEMKRMAAEIPKLELTPEDEWKQMIESALLEIGSILGGA